jgi:hypothetical protein
MPKRDTYHHHVRVALEKDGWQITADPMTLEWEDALYYPDLGAERWIAAEKGLAKIAVEIKSFLGPYFQTDFYEAIGQYDNYAIALADLEPDRKIVLAVSQNVYESFFAKKSIQRILEIKAISLLVFNVENQLVAAWIR